MESTHIKKKSIEQALEILRRQCARMERSEYDVRKSMSRWQMTNDEIQLVVDQLTLEKFIDNARYAEAFVKDKLRFAGWGRRRIINQLKLKFISQDIINSLEYLFENTSSDKLADILEKKARLIKAKNSYDFKNKLVRFGLYRGFELDEVLSVATRITTKKYTEQYD